ncbi:arylsulfatase A-like enzyme [Maribacter vaceletii]|uniref:Arylsulfatase A-like enzyme n=1 Tax=Maribacter vaceletii TaxID=1206816 RepID=A0A495ECH3_9FLAO|nr:sulfatase [Maribacter vaceletii]RKR14329.1 arylsulfatase A-like enzyme [Maribacter vaceletii]
MRNIFIKKTILIFLSVITFFSCKTAEKTPEKQPNIVWIVSEDNSKHYLKLFDENGIETPNIASLTNQGVMFTRAFSNAPVCSVARSTIISGTYAPRTGVQFHRKSELAPLPDGLHMFPAYLKQAGYYTTNNSKEDYNFVKSDTVWDDSSKKASYRNRSENQPFFHVFNIGTSHESRIHFTKEDMDAALAKGELDSFNIQPNHPQTELFQYTNVHYRNKIQEMDQEVGAVIKELKEDGLLEDTFIFYYGDHGGVLPGSKGYLYETGLHVPMIVRVPENYKHLTHLKPGSTTENFVSFIDLAPTVLKLANVSIPEQIDGKPFLTPEETKQDHTTFGYADRFDEKYDLVRSVRKGKYKYIRNFQPFNFDGLMNNYRYKQLAYKEWETLYNEGKLNDVQSTFFKSKAPEMLFDVENDPYETKNLANDAAHKNTLLDLRSSLNTWIEGMPDLSFYPEHYIIDNALKNPVKWGQEHKKDIKKYITTANLMLQDFSSIKEKVKVSLASKDPWERYWALIVCSSFGKEANALKTTIKNIAKTDPQALNKVRAAEFLGLTKNDNPEQICLEALYSTNNPVEALLILNSITLLSSKDFGYSIQIDTSKLKPTVLKDAQVLRRIEYLIP